MLSVISWSLCNHADDASPLDDDYDDQALIDEFISKQSSKGTSAEKVVSSQENQDNRPFPSNGVAASRPSSTETSAAKPLTIDKHGENSEEVLKEKAPCVCVKYFLCNIDNGTVIDDGNVLGLIDIRLGNTKSSPCDHYFDICCQVCGMYY